MDSLRRHILGITGILFLVLALVLAATSGSGNSNLFVIGLLTRTGSLLLVLWFALPSVIGLYRHFPKWVWVVSILALVAAVVQRNLILIVGVMFAVLVFFQIVAVIIRPVSPPTKESRKRSS